ncbi:MAG TPA: hypothetical protein DCE41_14910 [Cytophagales bacterium]|nr:hypothetical protein [Cytophagales bacterium]HAA24058.1 hypothetical protein [Cytophagales bacterium]
MVFALQPIMGLVYPKSAFIDPTGSTITFSYRICALIIFCRPTLLVLIWHKLDVAKWNNEKNPTLRDRVGEIIS